MKRGVTGSGKEKMIETKALELLNEHEKNLEWFRKQSRSLKEEHNNKFIAIEEEEVIATADSVQELIKKLKKEGKNPAESFVKFVSKTKTIF